MERSESILALVKVLNAHRGQLSIPVIRTQSSKSIELKPEPKTQPKREKKSFSKLKPKTKPASKSNWKDGTLSESKQQSKHFLEQAFLRNGCIRKRKIEKMVYSRKSKIYKLKKYEKGYEIRLATKDEGELKKIREAISELGLTVSNTFSKNNRLIQPIYSKALTLDFEKLRNNYQQSE